MSTFRDFVSGIDFPHKPVDHQIETEGLAKLAKIAGYSVAGLPNYIVWHFDTAEKEGNLHETPPWLLPLLVICAAIATVVSIRYRRWLLNQGWWPKSFRLYRSEKARQY